MKQFKPESPKEKAIYDWVKNLPDQSYTVETEWTIGVNGNPLNLPYSKWCLVYNKYTCVMYIKLERQGGVITSFVSLEEFLASSKIPEKIRRSILFNLNIFLR